MRTLFVTWDGPGLAYLDSLFLPIFERLGAEGFPFDVLQFRWGDQREGERLASRCRDAGIGYASVSVSRRGGPIGPMITALTGGAAIRRAIARFGSDAVMLRSVLPSVAALAGGIAKRTPLIYDADGLELDERVEFAGLSPNGLTYKWLRRVESRMTRTATCLLTRTEAARTILLERAGLAPGEKPFFIVTNGRDPGKFRPFSDAERRAMRDKLGISQSAPLIVYAGSVGYRYDTGRIGQLALSVSARRPDARLLVLSGNAEAAASQLGIGENSPLAAMTRIMAVPPSEVPTYLAPADIGTAYVRTSFSTQAVAPIKVGEYLLCGVPLVGAAAVGNNRAAVEAGVYLDTPTDTEAAADWLVDRVLPDRERLRRQAREIGCGHYSLDRSVADYRAALQALASGRSGRWTRPNGIASGRSRPQTGSFLS
jgi:glycosyltransferase involved in cell wall biosynthesis